MSNPIQGFPQGSIDLRTGGSPAKAGGAPGDSEFMSTLRNAMDQVGDLQSQADGKVAQLLSGNGQDVHSAMIAVEKASLAFQMMVQVRNKIVQAYQQVSGIPF
ncbi:MAG TPA: flagellar hook-basal body complex protein FliE [Candidatus Acidoferrum sp.]